MVLFRVTSPSFCHSNTHLFPLWSSWAAFGLWEYQVCIFLVCNFLHPQTPPPFLNHWVLYDLWHRIHWKPVGWIEIPFLTEGMNFKPLSEYRAKNYVRTERVDRVEMHGTSVWKALSSDPGRETITGCYDAVKYWNIEEELIVTHLVKKSPTFVEPEIWFLCM